MKYNLEWFKVKGEKQFSPVNQIKKIRPALGGQDHEQFIKEPGSAI